MKECGSAFESLGNKQDFLLCTDSRQDPNLFPACEVKKERGSGEEREKEKGFLQNALWVLFKHVSRLHQLQGLSTTTCPSSTGDIFREVNALGTESFVNSAAVEGFPFSDFIKGNLPRDLLLSATSIIALKGGKEVFSLCHSLSLFLYCLHVSHSPPISLSPYLSLFFPFLLSSPPNFTSSIAMSLNMYTHVSSQTS